MRKALAKIVFELGRIVVGGVALWQFCKWAGSVRGYAIFLLVWAALHLRRFSLPSPSGRGELRGWFVSFAIPVYLAWIPLYLGLFRALFNEAAGLAEPWGALAFLPLWQIFGFTFAMVFLPIFSIRCLTRIQATHPTRRFLFIGGWDGSRQEHLWLEAGDFCDGECLLITSHDEHHCECYLWLPDSEPIAPGRRVKFPDINLVFGRYPRLRRVLLSHDWEWLESLWEKHGYDPKTATPPDFPWSSPKARIRAEQVAEFFNRTLPTAMGFPNLDRESLNWKGVCLSLHHPWKRMAQMIPLESRLYRAWGDEAAAGLRELKAKPKLRSERTAVGDSA